MDHSKISSLWGGMTNPPRKEDFERGVASTVRDIKRAEEAKEKRDILNEEINKYGLISNRDEEISSCEISEAISRLAHNERVSGAVQLAEIIIEGLKSSPDDYFDVNFKGKELSFRFDILGVNYGGEQEKLLVDVDLVRILAPCYRDRKDLKKIATALRAIADDIDKKARDT